MFQKIKDYVYEHRYLIGGVVVIGGLTIFLATNMSSVSAQQTLTSQFMDSLRRGLVKAVEFSGSTVIYKTSAGLFKTFIDGVPSKEIYKLLSQNPSTIYHFNAPAINNNSDLISALLLSAGIISAASLYYRYLTDSKFGLNKPECAQNNQVRFEDIYGNEGIKDKLRDFIDCLKNPQKYRAIGARTRKGIMLYGPPGTGKTMIAKATAYESGVDFIYCSAAEFQEIYVGVGPKRIRELFARARACKQGCIIFIDEIDAIGNRSALGLGSSQSQKNSTINQLLVEMDGFYENSNILVIGATNRIDAVDEALLRPSRFDLKISTDLPTFEQRIGIVNIHLKTRKHTVSNNIVQYIAEQTTGYSGAELEHITNESAYLSLKKGRDEINDSALLEALLIDKKNKIRK